MSVRIVKRSFVETQMTPATTGAVFTTKEMESAKLDCLKELKPQQ